MSRTRLETIKVLTKMFVGLLLVGSGALAQSPTKREVHRCHARADLVGKCFTVHGRLQINNGTPSIRLWRIGTKRMLGVLDPQDISGVPGPSTIPASIAKQLDFDKYAFGDFLVCPLSKSMPGRMQTICIESGSHLIVRNR